MAWHLSENSDYLEHVTEDAVAVRFAQREAGRLRYCHDARAWFVWDGGLWRRDRTGVALQRARDVARQASLDPFDKPRVMAGSRRFMIGVEHLARVDPAFAVTAADWDADPRLLGTPAGTLDLVTGEMAEAEPKDGISHSTAVAPAATADCPLWRGLLDELTSGDAGLVAFLQNVFGSMLTGAGERLLLFSPDRDGTGAAVLMATIAGILGDYARPMSPAPDPSATDLCATDLCATDLGAADLAALRGTRLVTASESVAGRPWPLAHIRLFTGPPVGGHALASSAKLFVVGAAPPVLHHLHEALRQNICVVPLRRREAAPDRARDEKLEAERPAILRWMIEGCRDGLAKGVVRPPRVIESTRRAFLANDVFGQFLEDKCVCGPGDRAKAAPAGALFAEWSDYAEAAGERPGSPRTFAEALLARGFTRDRLVSGRIFRGVGLRSAPAPGERYAERLAQAERAGA